MSAWACVSDTMDHRAFHWIRTEWLRVVDLKKEEKAVAAAGETLKEMLCVLEQALNSPNEKDVEVAKSLALQVLTEDTAEEGILSNLHKLVKKFDPKKYPRAHMTTLTEAIDTVLRLLKQLADMAEGCIYVKRRRRATKKKKAGREAEAAAAAAAIQAAREGRRPGAEGGDEAAAEAGAEQPLLEGAEQPAAEGGDAADELADLADDGAEDGAGAAGGGGASQRAVRQNGNRTLYDSSPENSNAEGGAAAGGDAADGAEGDSGAAAAAEGETAEGAAAAGSPARSRSVSRAASVAPGGDDGGNAGDAAGDGGDGAAADDGQEDDHDERMREARLPSLIHLISPRVPLLTAPSEPHLTPLASISTTRKQPRRRASTWTSAPTTRTRRTSTTRRATGRRRSARACGR